MKIKFISLISIFIIYSASSVYAVDYYPELGVDPFYSSLNPAYIDKEQTVQKEDTLVNIVKNIKKNKVNDKEKDNNSKIKQNTSGLNDLTPIKENNDNKNADKNIEKNSSSPKKTLTKIELEKELIKEEREKEKALQEKNKKSFSFKNRFFVSKKKKKETETQEVTSTPGLEITADFMDYYPEKYEVEAVGNARVEFKKEDTILKANKIIFNYDKNILTANENVILSTGDTVTEGDFIRIDLNKPDGWIENPITDTEDIKLSAKEAFIYSDRIEEYDGVAKILKDDVVSFGARSFAAYVDPGRIFKPASTNVNDLGKGVYKLKAETILIESKDEHEVVTVKNAKLYLKNHKLATVPCIKIVTNKQHEGIETNIPEFGAESMLGMHIGPAVVLNVPGGSTLKLAPILTYKDDKLGVGGIARFRNESNMTEVAYGTSVDQLLIRGRQKLAPGLLLNYSRYTNQNEWFLGYRMPKYSTQLSYSRSDYVKDLKLNFSQMYSAGMFVDNNDKLDLGDVKGRFRWMTQTYKPLYKYNNSEGNVGIRAGLVAQTAATLYSQGNTHGLLRVGPAISTKIGPWSQAFMYYQSAIAGNSPFIFDRYRYGRSNVVLIESLKVTKYLGLGYLASLALNNDFAEDRTLQENRLLISIGPDYAKVTIGYDAIRRNTMFVFSMLVGTKDSDITFKKTIITNPDQIGKTKSETHKKKKKKKSYKEYLKVIEK